MKITHFIALCGLIIVGIYFLEGEESDASKLDKILTEAQMMPDFEDDPPHMITVSALDYLYADNGKPVKYPCKICK